ncbi:ABC transporter ATP-binding protein [Devosia oryziradicis]|uniref:ABC transporter ATP-binding protein n=1 Tax=Devosia oryziradicis TaxID=2801335 RepID=A0ABX7BZ01_9HYPH|nr:ABC transporter ATP-binding protein [Devosia oryziradicis]QQR36737.1 ABC transporter ATP-binding protein [Devosia oryziradicis]
MNTSRPSGGAALNLSGVCKNYGQVSAVKPLDLDIAPGSLVTLLGPSGCGKTTLLRMIAGLERVSGGRITIGGRDVTQASAGERNVTMVFQSYALFPHMSVLDNVSYGLISSGVRKADAYRQAEAALETVGLKGFGGRLPSEMSGGQQQRVAVARALVLNPDVLLFDEPLSNLDAKLRRNMREEIRALQQRLGVTVVYVTHDQSEALAVSDQIVVMRNAEIAQLGTPRELYKHPESVFVATFMGDANHVRGTLSNKAGDSATVELGTIALSLPHRDLPEGPVDVIIRPECIRFSVGVDQATLEATVLTATYMGSHAEYNLETPIGRLFVVDQEGPSRLHAIGERVRVSLAEHGVLVVRP